MIELQKVYAVYICARNERKEILSGIKQEYAERFCERNGWKMQDKNGKLWSMEIEECRD